MVHMKTTLSVNGRPFSDTRARRESSRRERALSRCSLHSRDERKSVTAEIRRNAAFGGTQGAERTSADARLAPQGRNARRSIRGRKAGLRAVVGRTWLVVGQDQRAREYVKKIV